VVTDVRPRSTGVLREGRAGNPRPLLRRKLRRDLAATRWQVVAVVLTVLLGVLLFAASFDAFRNLTASYQQTYDDLAFADLVISGGEQQDLADLVAAEPGVAVVEQRTQADVPVQVLRNGEEHTMLGRLVGMPSASQPDVNRVDVLTGDYLDPADESAVLVEKHMSDHFGLGPGDTVTALLADGPRELTVRGTVASPEYLWPAQDRQSLFSLPDEFGVMFAADELIAQVPPGALVDQTQAVYSDGVDVEALDDRLSALAYEAGASDVVTAEDQASNAALSEDLAAFGELSFMFPALFLSGAGFATFIILNRLVSSQRGQIGVLMATGLTRREVLRHYVGYGLVVGTAGAVLGLLLGVPAGALITSTYTQLLSIPDTVVRFYWTTPLVGLLFGLVMGALSSWAPARSAVRVPPALAMRGEVPEHVGGGRSLPEKLLPQVSRLPVRYRISLRGIGRHKTRSAATVAGVALAIILVLASWGMIDTIDRLLAKQFDVVAREDAQVFLTGSTTEPAVESIEALPGVEAAEAVLSMGVTLVAGSGQYATDLQAFQADTTMHGFVGLDGDLLGLRPGGILVGQATRDVLDLSAGDPVTLRVPSVGAQVDTTVADFVDEPLGTYAYAERDWLIQALTDAGVEPGEIASPAISSVLVQYAPGADAGDVLVDLERLPEVGAAVSATALRDLFEQYFTFFYAFVGVMLVLGGILAFALIFNMVTATLAERAAELATMRASGVSVQDVNRMMTVENLVLTLMGIPTGLVLGYVTASVFMSSFSSDLFSFDLDMNPLTMVWTALAVLVVAMLSQIPGLRAVRRLDIATVVRQRTL